MRPNARTRIRIVTALLMATLSACTTLAGTESGTAELSGDRATATSSPLSGATEAGSRVAGAALNLVGRPDLIVDGRRFNYDCTGTILAAYYSAGYDLAANFGAYTGNGVRRLYLMADDQGRLQRREPLRPGDIIFWDNSYDMNGDGRWNDELTHAGIVVDVAADGRVTYVHHNYRRGVVTATLSPRRPSDSELNSPMRMKSHRWRESDPWLSGELYRAHGGLY